MFPTYVAHGHLQRRWEARGELDDNDRRHGRKDWEFVIGPKNRHCKWGKLFPTFAHFDTSGPSTFPYRPSTALHPRRPSPLLIFVRTCG